MKWLDGITNSMDTNLANSGRQWRTGKPGMLQSMQRQRVRHDLEIEQQRKCKLEIVFSREMLEMCDGHFHKFLPILEDVIFPSIIHFWGLLEQGTYVTAPPIPPHQSSSRASSNWEKANSRICQLYLLWWGSPSSDIHAAIWTTQLLLS